ncbi:NUDIX hydrolase [Falsibacillus pallidus]|uniref:NUDIX hydrolase n=1 Tax=Falsibacillus pallidus TaxID=493781 RepID=UPI003D95B8AB
MDILTFGEKENRIEYIFRPAVYGLMFNKEKDKIAIIQTAKDRYFLPGGGIEKEETHEKCLKRESIEEMGMNVKINRFIGCARRYFYSKNDNKHYLNEGYFYLCELGKQITEPLEEDHQLIWMDPLNAADCLVHEHQSWAVKQVLPERE